MAQFSVKIIRLTGSVLSENQQDTVLLGEVAELLVTFTQPATEHRPFMIHCHILDHEDAGLMGQFVTS